MRELLAIGAGGCVGAIARALLTGFVGRWLGAAFPWATLAVNAAGCLALGLLVAAVEARGALSPALRAFLVVGVLSSFTTFSTFSYETWLLARDGAWAGALGNVALSLAVGLAALACGLALGARIFA